MSRITRSIRNVYPLAAGALLLGGACARPALAADMHGKADLFLTRRAAKDLQAGWTSVIIRLDGGLTASNRAQLAGLGADVYRHLDIIGSVAARVPNRNLGRLAALPCITRLSTDIHVKKTDEFTVEHSGADVAWAAPYSLNGSGVGVAVLDTGVHFSNDLAVTTKGGSSRIVGRAKFGPTNDDDFCGHGTHVAAIIAGNGAASTGSKYFRTFYGIARQANIINVCVLDKYGRGDVSNLITGIQWCVTNKSKYNIRVMNLSLGHAVGESYTTDPLCQAVEAAWNSGIVVVCAAGNEGRMQDDRMDGLDNEGYGTNYGSVLSPGNDPCVITVGAMKTVDGNRANDRIATYSGRGPSRVDLVMKPDIVAPGNQVISLNTNNSYLAMTYGSSNLIPLSSYCNKSSTTMSSSYFRLNGTSMASPVVAGAAALLLQKFPTLSPDTVKARLMLSADKWGFADGTTDPCTFGAGYLDIPSALSCTAVATQPALSPKLYQCDDGTVSIDVSSVWGAKAIWGTGVNDLKAIWGTKAIWGKSTLSSSRALWGTNVWSDKAIWGVNTNAVDLSSKVIQGE